MFLGPQIIIGAADRILREPNLELLQVQLQILNLSLAKAGVVIAKLFANLLLMLARQFQHRLIEIDADDFALWAHFLRADVTDLACAAPQVQHGFAFANPLARIAAAVVALDDLFGKRSEKF